MSTVRRTVNVEEELIDTISNDTKPIHLILTEFLPISLYEVQSTNGNA